MHIVFYIISMYSNTIAVYNTAYIITYYIIYMVLFKVSTYNRSQILIKNI